MADFTLHDHSSSSTTSSSSSSDDTDMSGMSHSSSSSSGTGMTMVFFTSTSTPLFAAAWTPRSTGTYVGTCVFLIVLGVIYRGLHAWKAVLERRWAAAVRGRVVVVAKGKESDEDDEGPPKETKEATPVAEVTAARSWRWSSDLPRAALLTVNSGVGYLL